MLKKKTHQCCQNHTCYVHIVSSFTGSTYMRVHSKRIGGLLKAVPRQFGGFICLQHDFSFLLPLPILGPTYFQHDIVAILGFYSLCLYLDLHIFSMILVLFLVFTPSLPLLGQYQTVVLQSGYRVLPSYLKAIQATTSISVAKLMGICPSRIRQVSLNIAFFDDSYYYVVNSLQVMGLRKTFNSKHPLQPQKHVPVQYRYHNVVHMLISESAL